MVKQHHHSQQLESIREFNASAFCTDVGVFLGHAEVHSDTVHSASGSRFEVTENVGDLWVTLFSRTQLAPLLGSRLSSWWLMRDL